MEPLSDNVITEWIIPGLVVIYRNWGHPDTCDAIVDALKPMEWFNKPVLTRVGWRLQAHRVMAFSDPGIAHYKYSGATIPTKVWTGTDNFGLQWVEYYRGMIQDMAVLNKLTDNNTDYAFDSCLLNEYRDGSEYLGWHSDKQGNKFISTVATLSLGASRHFYFMEKADQSNKIKLTLNNGDLVYMLDGCQQKYKHCIPARAAHLAGYRISLTYRKIRDNQ